MKPRCFPVLLLLIAMCVAPAARAAPPAEKAARIDKLVSQYAEQGHFSGTVLVSLHDKVLFKKAYGLANREWDIPNTPDTKFRIGSITKQFTAMLVLQQVQKGTIKLDAHVSDYLPYYRKDTGSKITIHQLLNHTSGIPSYTGNPKFLANEARNPYTPDEFVQKSCSGDLQFAPGSQWRYNNSGYFILGAILERVTGKPYEVLLQQSILEPLGMKDTGYDHFGTVLKKRASGYELELTGPNNAPYLDMSLPYAAGALYSTVEDLFLWDQALYTNKLLKAELKEKLFTPGMKDYGYGWSITPLPPAEAGGGGTLIQHGGGINGFNTLLQRLVRDHALIVILNNTPGANLEEMASSIRSILYDREPPALKRSLMMVLGPIIAARGGEAAVARYAELKRAEPNGFDFSEAELNNLGYLLLSKGRTQDAIAIFKLNVEQYPKSGNVYDSLAEAYESAGQKPLAIANYRKSVELDPSNQHGKDKLKELEGK
jgi:CubicO group peptidase (beta-lactamase class C family)